MGYLSQKKHQIREILFLNVTSIILTLFTLFSLTNANFDIYFPNLFHLYLFSFILFIYSLAVKKIKTSLIFLMLFIINYTALSASGNIFLSDSYDGDNKFELTFDDTTDINGNFYGAKTSTGTLILANNITASYIKITEKTPMTIIKVDLKGLETKLRKKILNQLRLFIIKQDNPVILFGDFGVPAWNRYLRKFIIQSRLVVKNNLLFTKNNKYNFLSMPSFYILGFNDMGIENIEIKNTGKKQTIDFDISF